MSLGQEYIVKSDMVCCSLVAHASTGTNHDHDNIQHICGPLRTAQVHCVHNDHCVLPHREQ